MQTRQSKLRKFAKDHLRYEVEQLHALTVRLVKIWDHDAAHGGRDLDYLDMATRNAQVESFAIHARALLDFLYTEPEGDDASAQHYVIDGWEPRELTDSLARVKRRVNKEIAHMTYQRVRLPVEARHWKYAQIWHDMAAVLREFVARASPELLPSEVASEIAKLAAPEPEIINVMALVASATNAEGGPGTATYRSA